ncbi:MAG: phasin family protein [Rubrivivax sp.]
MVKKVHKTASEKPSGAGLFDSQLAGAVKASAQQIWLAGMGAFAKAQEGRAKVFEALIKEGVGLQRKTQTAAEDAVGEVTGKMSAMAGDVSARAGQHWDKLEGIFEQRTAKAMNKLGVPTAKDVDALIKRVDDLAAAVARLSKTAPAAAKTSARPSATASKTASKAPAKAASKTAKKTSKPAAKRAPTKKRSS